MTASLIVVLVALLIVVVGVLVGLYVLLDWIADLFRAPWRRKHQ